MFLVFAVRRKARANPNKRKKRSRGGALNSGQLGLENSRFCPPPHPRRSPSHEYPYTGLEKGDLQNAGRRAEVLSLLASLQTAAMQIDSALPSCLGERGTRTAKGKEIFYYYYLLVTFSPQKSEGSF